MPTKNVPETQDSDEWELAYLLIMGRHVERQGFDGWPYAALVVAFLMAAGALSLLGVL